MDTERRMIEAATKAAVCRRSGDYLGADYWTEQVETLNARLALELGRRLDGQGDE